GRPAPLAGHGAPRVRLGGRRTVVLANAAGFVAWPPRMGAHPARRLCGGRGGSFDRSAGDRDGAARGGARGARHGPPYRRSGPPRVRGAGALAGRVPARRGVLDTGALRERELSHEAPRSLDFAATFRGVRDRLGGRSRPARGLFIAPVMSQTSLEIASSPKA